MKIRQFPLFYVHVIVFFLISLTTGCRSKKESPNTNTRANDADIKTSSMFIEGFRQEFLSNYEAAKNIFQRILATKPNHHPSHYELGKIYINEKNYSQAIEHLQQAVKLDPDNFWYKILLAHAHAMLGNYDQASAIYQKLTTQYPNSADFLIRLADMYAMANKPNKALETLNSLEKKFGLSEEVQNKKITLLLSMGQIEKAYQELQKLVQISPDNPDYLLKLAEYYLRTGRLNLGYKYLEKVIAFDPLNTLAQLYLADYYFIVKDTTKAKEQVSNVINSTNFSVDDKVFILLSILDKKELYGDTGIIYTFLNSVLTQYPQEAKVWALAGDIYYQNNKFSQAISAWEKSLQLDSSRYLVWESLLITQLINEDREGLFTYLPRAIELFPEQAHLHIINAYVDFLKQHYQQIISTLPLYLKHAQNHLLSTIGNCLLLLSKQYVRPSPSDDQEINESIFTQNELTAFQYLYYLINYKQDTTKALTWASDKLFSVPIHKAYYKALEAYFQKNYDTAYAYIQKVSSRLEYFPEIAELTGDIALQLGKPDLAIEMWTQAFTMTKSTRIGAKIQKHLHHEKTK